MLISLFPMRDEPYTIIIDKESRKVTIKYTDCRKIRQEISFKVPENVSMIGKYGGENVWDIQIYSKDTRPSDPPIQVSVFYNEKMATTLAHELKDAFAPEQIPPEAYDKAIKVLDDINKQLDEIEEELSKLAGIKERLYYARKKLSEIKERLGIWKSTG